MLNLASSLFPSRRTARGHAPLSRLGMLARWVRERSRYPQALRELYRLDGRDLDEIGLGRADFPQLAERHAAALEPLTPSRLVSLRRL